MDGRLREVFEIATSNTSQNFRKRKKNTGGKHVYNVFEVLLLVPSGGDLALCVVCLFSKAVRLVLLLSFCLKLIFASRASHMALC